MRNFTLALLASVLAASCSNGSEFDLRSRAAVDNEDTSELSLADTGETNDVTATIEGRLIWKNDARPRSAILDSTGRTAFLKAHFEILNQNQEVVATAIVGAGGKNNYRNILSETAKIEFKTIQDERYSFRPRVEFYDKGLKKQVPVLISKTFVGFIDDGLESRGNRVRISVELVDPAQTVKPLVGK